ncbi:MAG: NUDIX domain-containing protein [bacterium]|nr:NUDIX domain-containing protein [bacterium]MDZ4296019.1 NUDIX domain-containing protein [Patescibacteria group bacterium]
MPETPKQFIDKLAWICIKDRVVLSTRSRGKDTYYIPGGKREGDETDEEALLREIKEELSVDLLPETIAYVGTFEAQAHGKPEGTVVRMTCYSGNFAGEIRPATEIEEVVWLTHAGREQSSPVDKIILDRLKEKNLID